MSLKNPVTPPEIDPGSVRLVGQPVRDTAGNLKLGRIFTVISKAV